MLGSVVLERGVLKPLVSLLVGGCIGNRLREMTDMLCLVALLIITLGGFHHPTLKVNGCMMQSRFIILGHFSSLDDKLEVLFISANTNSN